MRTKRPTETQLLVDARAIERDLYREPVAHRRPARKVSAAQRRRWAFQASAVESTAAAVREHDLERQALAERERMLGTPEYMSPEPDDVDTSKPEWVIENGVVVA